MKSTLKLLVCGKGEFAEALHRQVEKERGVTSYTIGSLGNVKRFKQRTDVVVVQIGNDLSDVLDIGTLCRSRSWPLIQVAVSEDDADLFDVRTSVMSIDCSAGGVIREARAMFTARAMLTVVG